MANLHASKRRRCLGQGRVVLLDERMAFQRTDGDERAQTEPTVWAIADLVQPRDALDVEHIPRLPGPLAPAYQDVGRPGDNSCPLLLAHHLDGFLHRLGFPVFEAVHRRSPISRRSLVSPHHTARVDKIQQVSYDHIAPAGCHGLLFYEEAHMAAVEGVLSALERNWEMVDGT